MDNKEAKENHNSTTLSPIVFSETHFRENDIEIIERLLIEAEEKNQSVFDLVNHTLTPLQESPLHIAAEGGFFDLVCLLLQNGANVNALDKNNWTPLHSATKHSHLDITQVLLNKHADITLQTESGTTAFHYLVRFKVHPKQIPLFKSVLDSMLTLGQDIDVQNENGETPLHQAALNGCLYSLKWLLDHKAIVDKKTHFGETALHFACRAGQKEIAILLLDGGAGIDVQGAYGTPRTVAEHCTLVIEAIDEYEAAKELQDYDDSSDEEEFEFSNLVNAIPEELRLSISPAAYNVSFINNPASSMRRTRRVKTKQLIFNGPLNMVPEQRRLRHIKGIYYRNLTINEGKLVKYYFTVQLYSGTSNSCALNPPILYTSNITEERTINPTWELPFENIIDEGLLRLPRCTIKIWEKDITSKCILETNIRLYKLGFISQDIHKVNIPISNLLILELQDGFYVKEDIANSHPLTTNLSIQAIPAVSPKQQYNILLESVKSLEKNIENENTLIKEREIECIESRKDIIPNVNQVSKSLINILELKQTLQLSIRSLNGTKTQLVQDLHTLHVKQYVLIRELRSILPITQSSDAHQSLCIHNIRLPNTDFTGCAEESIATGLGLVSQVLHKLSLWLDVPLRYQMTPACSRSIISDKISNVYPSTSSFPLYSRGVDKTRFEYAVYLLNKNLEQLLNSQDLDIITLRHTLPNLQLLLVRSKRLRSKSKQTSAPR